MNNLLKDSRWNLVLDHVHSSLLYESTGYKVIEYRCIYLTFLTNYILQCVIKKHSYLFSYEHQFNPSIIS
jgi:hypothetical protein